MMRLYKLLNLVWHHCFVFFQTIRGLPPIIIWLLMMAIIYDYRYPLDVGHASMYAASGLFFIMVWLGYLFLSSFNQTAEHIMMLQINSRKLYTLGKIVFLLVCCIALSVLGSVYPIIISKIWQSNGVPMYANGIQHGFFLWTFFLHFIYGVLGLSVALLFHPNPTKRRDDFSLVMLMMFTVFSYTKGQLVDIHSWFGFTLWVFPPVADIALMFKGESLYNIYSLSLAALYGLAYSAAAVAIGQWIYHRRVYGPRIATVEKKAS